MKKKEKFTWLDSEILWAISCLGKSEGATREDILTCVDSHQHMLLPKNKLSQCFHRLDYLIKQGFRLSSDGIRMIKS